MSTLDNSLLALSDRLETDLSPFVTHGAVAGLVATVADAQGILGQTALGFADIAHREPMTPNTLFWVASQTKPITGTALMMLVDDGKVALDDPLEKYLPEFQDVWVLEQQDDTRRTLVRPERSLTIRDVLSHTSGMPPTSAVERPTLDLLPLRIGTLSYAMTPLGAQPGSRYEYSNAGINTAGRIIEVVSGVAYETFLQERLFSPLGMTDTTFWPNKEQVSRLAKTYTPNAEKDGLIEMRIDQLRYPLDDPTRQPMPAGGLFSTAKDMVTFCQMILSGGTYASTRYASPSAVSEMTSKQTGAHVRERYGLGWGIGDSSYGHGGAYSTAMNIYPDQGRIAVFLVQHAGFLYDGDKCRGVFESITTSSE